MTFLGNSISNLDVIIFIIFYFKTIPKKRFNSLYIYIYV